MDYLKQISQSKDESVFFPEFPISDLTLQVKDLALRKARTDTAEYQLLKLSVQEFGVKTPLVCHVGKDANNQDVIVLDNGAQRRSVLMELGKPTAPVLVYKNVTAVQGLLNQLTLNHSVVPTRPCEYGHAIQAILHENLTLNIDEVAKMLGMTSDKVNQYLSLNKLDANIQKQVDDNLIPLALGVSLSRLPVENQIDALKEVDLEEETKGEKVPVIDKLKKIAEISKSLKDAAKIGKVPEEKVFTPTPRLRPVKLLQQAISDPSIQAEISQTITSNKKPDVILGVLSWVLQLDNESVQNAKESYEKDKKLKEELKKAKEIEAARKKLERTKKAEAKAAAELAEKDVASVGE